MVKGGFSIGINTHMVHSEIAQNRSAGAGTAKENNAIMTITRKGIRNYETQKGVLTLAPQKYI